MPLSATTFSKSKPGRGRPKGALNKTTAILRSFLATVTDDNQVKFEQELMKLEGEKFVHAYLTMLEYCTPKLARIEVKAEVEKRTIQVIEIDGEKIPI